MAAEKAATMQEVLLVEKRVEFDADIDRVWDAIANPESIVKWFPDEVNVDEFAVGQRGTLVWNTTECAGPYEFEIVELVERERVVWRWGRDANKTLEDTPTTVAEFNLREREGGGTVLHLRESGFVSEEDRQGNDGGWDNELAELAEYLRTQS